VTQNSDAEKMLQVTYLMMLNS